MKHKFCRIMATAMIDKGMPIEQVHSAFPDEL